MCRRHQAVLNGSSIFHLLAGSIFVLLTYGCAPVNDVRPTIESTQIPTLIDYSPPIPAPSAATKAERIILARASWYGPAREGRKTASGERFSSSKMTAAARGLPLGARVVVTNMSNGRSAKVRIKDCGPFRHGRKIDLSKRAAHKIGIIHDGTAAVRIKVVEVPPGALVCES